MLRLRSPKAVLVVVCIAELMAMSLWFSGTVVAPFLARNWPDSSHAVTSLTLAVVLGFVSGALLISIFNLNDQFSATRVVAYCAWIGALANYGCYVYRDSPLLALALRFLTGMALAGTYPSGMKLLAGWFERGRGFALGTMVGSLAVGSALPHLIAAVGAVSGQNWHLVMRACSVLAFVAGALVLMFIHDGPYNAPSAPFDVRQVGEVLRNRRLRLATFGYLGHMWELYSLWTWIAVMLGTSFAAGVNDAYVQAISFSVMAVGAFGCIWAGVAADRADRKNLVESRSRVTIIAMVLSGVCCLLTAAFFSHPKAVIAIAFVWGVAVIADSAQFSAIVSEVADKRYVGTALTVQVALGFLLTVGGVRLTEMMAGRFGWPTALATLALGPILGTCAMLRLSAE